MFRLTALRRLITDSKIATKHLVWLERGFVERDPRMAMLPIESKWDNLRDDPRFQDLLRRMGLSQ